MSNFNISFAALVKNNNGLFKSAAQAKLLTSQLDSDMTITIHFTGYNCYTFIYTCDALGVTQLVKHTNAQGEQLVWQRVTDGQVAVQQTKEARRITREIKRLQQQLTARDADFAAGEYSDVAQYDASTARDLEQLASYKALQ